MDMRNWQGAMTGFSGGWAKVGSAVRIGDLRLWKPTLALADYNIEFGTACAAAPLFERALEPRRAALENAPYLIRLLSYCGSILIVCVTGWKADLMAAASGARSDSVFAATPSMSVFASGLRNAPLICCVS